MSSSSKCCSVCGHPNARLNYNGISCIPCKSFFIRANESLGPYICPKRGECSVIATEPNYCMGCRYRKCLRAGMDPTLVGRMGRFDDAVGKLTNKVELIQRHVVPILSLGFHFVSQATCNLGPAQFARYFLNIDKISMNQDLYALQFTYFNMNVSLADAFVNSKLCYSCDEMAIIPAPDAAKFIIAHGYCKFLASFANFASALPELRFLSTTDKMRLIQNNHFEVAILRTLYYHHCDDPIVRAEKEIKMVEEVEIFSKDHAILLRHFLKFYHQNVSETFTMINLSLEEMILVRIIAVFLPFPNISDEGNDIVRSARGKYTNILIQYQNEVYSYMSPQEKLIRLGLILRFLIKLKEYANEINQLWALQILNNVDNLTGTLSYDLHVRTFRD